MTWCPRQLRISHRERNHEHTHPVGTSERRSPAARRRTPDDGGTMSAHRSRGERPPPSSGNQDPAKPVSPPSSGCSTTTMTERSPMTGGTAPRGTTPTGALPLPACRLRVPELLPHTASERMGERGTPIAIPGRHPLRVIRRRASRMLHTVGLGSRTVCQHARRACREANSSAWPSPSAGGATPIC